MLTQHRKAHGLYSTAGRGDGRRGAEPLETRQSGSVLPRAPFVGPAGTGCSGEVTQPDKNHPARRGCSFIAPPGREARKEQNAFPKEAPQDPRPGREGQRGWGRPRGTEGLAADSPAAQPRHVAQGRGHAQERLLLLVHGGGGSAEAAATAMVNAAEAAARVGGATQSAARHFRSRGRRREQSAPSCCGGLEERRLSRMRMRTAAGT